jgi:DsbC/DsbD-like thiol-disulfide interchange protein
MNGKTCSAKRRIQLLAVGLAFGMIALLNSPWTAAGDKSEPHAKFSATAGKVDDNGRQTVTITMEVKKGWHAYANPVKHKDVEDGGETVVKISSPQKLEDVKITYPAGTKWADKRGDTFMIYEGKVEISVALKRAAGDVGPLDVLVRYMTCNDSECVPANAKFQAK